MDREQEEMQFIGFFGIFKETFRIISTWRKIFTQITLSLLLPLAIIFLAEMIISDIVFFSIIAYELQQLGSSDAESPTHTHLTKLIPAEWVYFLLFKVAYFTFLLILSLFSTAAVVYTIASIYTSREITFKKVISVVPRIWKRLMVTFLCMFLAFFIYNLIAFALIWAATIAGKLATTILIFVILILYASGFIYMSIVWQLASVVSVLETLYGFKAMTKAMKLIKGQRFIVIVILSLLDLTLAGIQLGFEILAIYNLELVMWKQIGYGILFFLILTMLFLFGLVIQTVVYLVCKSHRHENIDKPSLADHLDSYSGDYERLVSMDVQLQQQSNIV